MEKALKQAEKQTQKALNKQQLRRNLSVVRKTLWFEKFHWFLSSDNYLVIRYTLPPSWVVIHGFPLQSLSYSMVLWGRTRPKYAQREHYGSGPICNKFTRPSLSICANAKWTLDRIPPLPSPSCGMAAGAMRSRTSSW
jgi:hypothetical protein